MPTYDYECQACGHKYELFQSITAEPIKKCPKCGKLKAKRLIGTGGGFVFKGSGFYITDYRSDSYKNAAKAEKTSSTPKSEAKTDSSTKAETSTSSKKKTVKKG